MASILANWSYHNNLHSMSDARKSTSIKASFGFHTTLGIQPYNLGVKGRCIGLLRGFRVHDNSLGRSSSSQSKCLCIL
jgi:hypothetical protein